MGRTRGVFSRPQSEGARGFKSPSLQQAVCDLRQSLENPAKFAQVRGFPQSTRNAVASCAPTAPRDRQSDAGPYCRTSSLQPTRRATTSSSNAARLRSRVEAVLASRIVSLRGAGDGAADGGYDGCV